MAYKVFVSYKFKDPFVNPIGDHGTCRDYVDALAEILADIHIYKGDEDGNDLSAFTDKTIQTRLKEKIHDSSVTVVLISKGMRDPTSPEETQWIPWEVAYSLRETTRNGRPSRTNGLLAVIIPDETNSYGHYFKYSDCLQCNVRTHQVDNLFEILRENMFNKKVPTRDTCPVTTHATTYHVGPDHSYAHQVTWDDFIKNPTLYIERAVEYRDNAANYNIQKLVKKQ